NQDLEISAGKVVASLYSAASDGGKGGDIYYFGVCKGDRITRLAIADVVGHGEAVTEAPSPEDDLFGNERLKDVLDANIKAPLSELRSAVLKALHQHTKKELTHDDVTLIVLEIC
ncbi:MAG: SpoIIE family protein phosphatase, partial [Candidatus Desulfatibia sp.]|uniref:SpoIIE family protein phosphatase n=1 Tax=Candidatus Desulfatibia sp. TaxID=3101189 RepID=UPI002F346F56